MIESQKFKKVIREEVEVLELSRQQLVEFAWRCAIRTLPFLGANNNLDCWKRSDRLDNLLSIFYALDILISEYDDSSLRSAQSKVISASRSAIRSFRNDGSKPFSSIHRVITSALIVSEGINIALKSGSKRFSKKDRYYVASMAASTAANTGLVYNVKLTDDIQRDISDLKHGSVTTINPEVVYGEWWKGFTVTLENEGCEYWGRLYYSIFKSGFKLEEDALQRRLNVPKEIRSRGAAAVADYLSELERKGSACLNEARIIILGDKGSGKTCIARKIIDPAAQMTTDDESTAGVDTTLWELKDREMNVSVWDFAGHTVTHAVHQFFLSERCLYIIVYDGRTEERTRYWLDHMQNYGGESQAILLINKRDRHRVEVPINSLKEKYSILNVFEFSIKNNKSELEEFRRFISDFIVSNPSWRKQEIPENHYQVKEELESKFSSCENGSPEEFIKKETFSEIAQKYDVSSESELLENLHALGVSLWYKNMEKYNTLVLNPEWISHGVYKIINWVHGKKKHLLILQEFKKIFEDEIERYPVDKHDFLFQLMQHYELAYESKDHNKLVIPHLLDEDRPEKLEDFPLGESLMLRYKSEQVLPPNTISRFIVRHHEEIKSGKNNVWRYGVVLKDEKGSIALIREEDRMISVSVKGSNRSNFISRLRDTLDDIFGSYKSQKPELQYRIERHGKIPDPLRREKNDLWLSDIEIVNHVRGNREYWDHATGSDIPLVPVVNNYNIKGDYKSMKDDHSINARDITNSQVDQTLTNCTNMIEQHSSGEKQDLLKKLEADIASLLQQLPEDKKDEEEQVAENLEMLVKQATAKKPNRKWYDVSTEGLLEASDWTKRFSGNICSTIGNLTKLVFPDS